jgi:hypothetical protein
MNGPDAIIVGGGPAGSVCASKLRMLGREVMVLERDYFPRFHLGESLLPQSLYVLDDIGVLPDVRERFIEKHGARFHDDRDGRKARFVFENAFDETWQHSFQVERAAFDELLLRHAGKLGADVREGWQVRRVLMEGSQSVGVLARDPYGAEHELRAPMVIDATGRGALQAHAARCTEKIPRLDKSAFYAHYEGIPRAAGKEAGDIDIVIFETRPRESDGAWSGGWFWFIPFKDGRTSVGAVVSSEWVKEHRHLGGADAMLQAAIDASPTATAFTQNATRLWPARVEADYSYRVGKMAGDGWVAIGDAAGFIDPLFSTGAHIAMRSGWKVASVIDEALRDGDTREERFAQWVQDTRTGAETFISAVGAFYRGPLLQYLFAENPRTVLRRSITSILAGDVFTSESIWIRDLRLRLAALNDSAVT